MGDEVSSDSGERENDDNEEQEIRESLGIEGVSSVAVPKSMSRSPSALFHIMLFSFKSL
jgi:hypothetical protein